MNSPSLALSRQLSAVGHISFFASARCGKFGSKLRRYSLSVRQGVQSALDKNSAQFLFLIGGQF
jgi:hypothetical protein